MTHKVPTVVGYALAVTFTIAAWLVHVTVVIMVAAWVGGWTAAIWADPSGSVTATRARWLRKLYRDRRRSS